MKKLILNVLIFISGSLYAMAQIPEGDFKKLFESATLKETKTINLFVGLSAFYLDLKKQPELIEFLKVNNPPPANIEFNTWQHPKLTEIKNIFSKNLFLKESDQSYSILLIQKVVKSGWSDYCQQVLSKFN